MTAIDDGPVDEDCQESGEKVSVQAYLHCSKARLTPENQNIVIQEFERRQEQTEITFALLSAMIFLPISCFFLLHAYWCLFVANVWLCA